MPRKIFNYLGLQLGWFACAWGAGNHFPWLGPLIVVIHLGIHLYWSNSRRHEAIFIGIVTLLGLLVDSLQKVTGLVVRWRFNRIFLAGSCMDCGNVGFVCFRNQVILEMAARAICSSFTSWDSLWSTKLPCRRCTWCGVFSTRRRAFSGIIGDYMGSDHASIV